jgi:hypothetical protein
MNIILNQIAFDASILVLMNENSDCTNILTREANIFKLTNSHHSVSFAHENSIAGKDFLHPDVSPSYSQIIA